MKLAPKTAVIIRDGVETKVPIEEVKKGDVFVVRPVKISRWTAWSREGNERGQ